MTVGELIEELEKHAVDAHVLMDVEGGHQVDVETLREDVNPNTRQRFVILRG
jgi:hypothetical protein